MSQAIWFQFEMLYSNRSLREANLIKSILLSVDEKPSYMKTQLMLH